LHEEQRREGNWNAKKLREKKPRKGDLKLREEKMIEGGVRKKQVGAAFYECIQAIHADCEQLVY
jgi:Ser/Thr protein kinase RdoA (MazF antagonist)